MEERHRRPSKAELEEDPFLEWVLQAAQYVKDRAQLFIGAAVAVVAIVVIVNFVQRQRSDARSRAAARLFEVISADRSGQLDQVIGLGQQLIDEYGGTPSAAQGMVLLANRYFAQGRYTDAQHLYRRYLDEYGDVEPLVFAARTGLAACQEAQGDFEAAARDYTAYADDHGGEPPSALALMDAVRCYRLLGDAVRQRTALERVTREYPASPVARRAREQLNLLM